MSCAQVDWRVGARGVPASQALRRTRLRGDGREDVLQVGLSEADVA
jgi:hypothetical protein